FFDRQDQRDAKREKETKEWREEQARREAKRDQRDAKREKETKEWREEQARREAKRDQRDAKREKETKEWRGEQARRDKAIINALTQLTRNPEHQTSRGKQPVSNTADPHTPLPRYNNSIDQLTPRLPNIQSQTKSSVAALSGTPQMAVQPMDQFTKDEYAKLSESYKDTCKSSKLADALAMLGDGWNGAWDEFCYNKTLADTGDVVAILKEYRQKCAGMRLKLGSGSVLEQVYQDAFGALAKAVQTRAELTPSTTPRLCWHDTHNRLIRRGDGRKRKPDGCFIVGSTGSVQWHNISVAVEIKGDSMDGEHHVIRGQILQDFIDMAEIMPRRFMLGLTLSRGGEIHLYVCVPGRIYIAPLYNLPSEHNSNTDSTSAKYLVAFLLFLHQQLGKDSGYLARHSIGLPCGFRLDSIVDTSRGSDNTLPSSTVISLNSADGVTGGVFGRHSHLKGQRTWSYPAAYSDGTMRNAFFKFQWGYDNDLEIDVHRFVLAKGVRHVPRLLYTASVEGKGVGPNSQRFKGEALVMEDVGGSIVWHAFDKDGLNMGDACIIDVFAGYVHTLIAAAVIDTQNKYALHRDVSMGNLMVSAKGAPYVIDWGCGRVCTHGEEPRSSGKQMIGTAIYMGIRILTNCATRSVVDDLESLFLVFCHCLWRRYGKRNAHYEDIWSVKSLSNVSNARIAWLVSEKNFFDRMGLSENDTPKALRALAVGMYAVLFPSKSPIHSFSADDDDPRVDAFDARGWLQVFDIAIGYASINAGVHMRCLHKLRKYVKRKSARRISFIVEPAIQPSEDSLEDGLHASSNSGSERLSDESNTGDLPESPTPSGFKKRPPGSLLSPASRKKRQR
ncbi:hypothetical protein H4217_007455, partial [Coemansia sp. RSA 1939]